MKVTGSVMRSQTKTLYSGQPTKYAASRILFCCTDQSSQSNSYDKASDDVGDVLYLMYA